LRTSICAVNPRKTQASQQQTHYNSEPQITLQSIARSCKTPFPYRLISFSSSSSCTQRQSQPLEKPKKTQDTQALTLTLNLMLGEVPSFNRYQGLRNCFFNKFPRFNKYWVQIGFSCFRFCYVATVYMSNPPKSPRRISQIWLQVREESKIFGLFCTFCRCRDAVVDLAFQVVAVGGGVFCCL
jgi:hypothetical protein